MRTPVWFAERDDKLYVITRNDSWKYRRIRNNPQVQVAPRNIRGKLRGPEFSRRSRILPQEDWNVAHKLIKRKYWLARLSFPNRKNVLLEIETPG